MRNPILEKEIEGRLRILGMDEAGRGPIAGPVCVAGVIFPPGFYDSRIDDSKKLSEKKRSELYSFILQSALWYRILLISEEDIDRLNIYQAVKRGMEEIALASGADYILTDAMKLNVETPWESVIKGDQKSISIAAASILAKVSRDRYMARLSQLYPQYNFSRHKGYPTKELLKAIEVYGVNEHFRKSYRPVADILHKESEITLF